MTPRQRKIGLVIASLIFLSGLITMIYPIVRNFSYQQQVGSQKIELINKIKNDVEYKKKSELLYEKLNEENIKLFNNKQRNLKDPFSYEETSIDLTEYEIEENCIGYITIPKMKVEIPIFLGASESNLSKGVAHLTETSYPIGGINTNAVLAAHRGHSSLKLFSDIQKLQLGDLIYIQNFREELIYEVSEIKIIDPDKIDDLLIVKGRDMITLITCHPKYVDNQRYVVFATRVNDLEKTNS